jgi:hypothetical protein
MIESSPNNISAASERDVHDLVTNMEMTLPLGKWKGMEREMGKPSGYGSGSV